MTLSYPGRSQFRKLVLAGSLMWVILTVLIFTDPLKAADESKAEQYLREFNSAVNPRDGEIVVRHSTFYHEYQNVILKKEETKRILGEQDPDIRNDLKAILLREIIQNAKSKNPEAPPYSNTNYGMFYCELIGLDPWALIHIADTRISRLNVLIAALFGDYKLQPEELDAQQSLREYLRTLSELNAPKIYADTILKLDGVPMEQSLDEWVDTFNVDRIKRNFAYDYHYRNRVRKEVEYWGAQASTLKEIPKLRSGGHWTHFTHKDLKIAVLIANDWGEGESFVSVSAYAYNLLDKEWQRFVMVKTRDIYKLVARINKEEEVIEIVASKKSPVEGRVVASFSLKVISNGKK